MSLIDILPTLLAQLGLAPPPGLQGQSLLPMIRGEQVGDPQRRIFTQARPEPERVKEVPGTVIRSGQILALRAWPHKLIAYPTADGMLHQLFDLATDPGEEHDLAAAEPETVQRLARELSEWRAQVGREALPPAPALTPEVRQRLEALGYSAP